MSSAAGPSKPPAQNGPPRDFTSKGGPRGRYQANLQKFGTPLPILLPCSPLHPNYAPPHRKPKSVFERIKLGLGNKSIVPQCIGVWDPETRSVVVSERVDMDILFRRGFFGKGTLSRSEPTWRERRVDLLKGGESSAAEKIREKRRLERKQFKIDRAAAMMSAAKTAEAIITNARENKSGEVEEDVDPDQEEEGGGEEDDTRSIATTATTNVATGPSGEILDIHSLTPQTFLVRPTRPDANRNRGKNAFKRKPKPKGQNPLPAQTDSSLQTNPIDLSQANRGDLSQPTTDKADTVDELKQSHTTSEVKKGKVDVETGISKAELEEEEEDWFDESLVEEAEHLQLGTEEAWFLGTCLNVLRIKDPKTGELIHPSDNITLFKTPSSVVENGLRPDDPFLVSYSVYHYFRTLGWVVKPGIKFCCDWMLYRKGPVFSHAAFSVVMIPVYDDPTDQETSPYGKEDWYTERVSWKWINTIMRVNSLVQKTVILVYVTIPSMASISSGYKLEDGTLDPRSNNMETLLSRYTVSEVSLQRFGPARRRD